MTEPYLTIHKQNILKFVNKAARGITDDTNKLLVTMDNKSDIFISNEIASVINDFNFTKRDDSYWSIVGKDCDIPESLKPTITQCQILLNLAN